MLYLFSGTRRQSLEFAHEQGLAESEWKHVSKPEDYIGRVDNNAHLLKIGTWFERPAHELGMTEDYFKLHKRTYRTDIK